MSTPTNTTPEKSEYTVRCELAVWWEQQGKDAIEASARLDEIEAILTGISPTTFMQLDGSVDHYPYGWLIRRWRNSRFTKSIFCGVAR
jgi:hypothetical protein